MATKNLNKTSRLERNQSISSGLRSACPKASIPVNGKLVKAADAAKAFDDASEAERNVILQRAKYLAAVEEARIAESKVKPMMQPLKSFVQNTFGERSDVAASFGFSPRKSAKISAEVRAEAAVKLRATRAARGTMGSRQKASVHGHVESPTPAPSQPAITTPAPVVTNGVTNGTTQSPLLSLNGAAH